MLAPSAATLPRGHFLIEPYLYDVTVQGFFDAKGVRHGSAIPMVLALSVHQLWVADKRPQGSFRLQVTSSQQRSSSSASARRLDPQVRTGLQSFMKAVGFRRLVNTGNTLLKI
jgi:hypothetical protein